MTLRLNGSTSGYVEIDAPAVAGNNTLALPSTPNGSLVALDSSGRLLVGTSTTALNHRIQVVGASDASAIAVIGRVADDISEVTFYENDQTTRLGELQYRQDHLNLRHRVGDIRFATGAATTERMRIVSDGTLLTFGAGNGVVSGHSAPAGTSAQLFLGIHSRTSTTAGGTTSFQVYTNGNVQNTNNSYGSLSDIKLKENIVDANSQWDDFKALQVRKYNFKEETGHQTHTQIGLVAQEAELVSPGLVSESPDRDEDGNDLGTVTKSVNYSVLYMKAVKALQEAIAKIESLEANTAALEARITALEVTP